MNYRLSLLAGSLCVVLLVLSLQGGPVFSQSPAGQLERIEWCDIWVTDADKNALPRVLLVGDSITRGYFSPVEKVLFGRAYCSRLTTSRSICDPVFYMELRVVIAQYPYAVIHFNNGLHGWGYTEAEYEVAFEKLLRVLATEAPQAKLIWASSTPVQEKSSMGDYTDRVAARNAIALRWVKKNNIPVNDLYAAMVKEDTYHSKDGVHFNNDGKAVQATQVIDTISKYLPAIPKN